MKPTTVFVIMVVIVFLTLNGCVATDDRVPRIQPQEQQLDGHQGDSEHKQYDGDKAQTGYGVYPGDKAFDFTLKDLEGNIVKLSDYRGKVVLLNFWQTTCGWCIKELPHLNSFYKNYKDGDVVVLAVNIGETVNEVSQAVQEEGFLFPVLLDEKADVAKRYFISVRPTNYVITKTGMISAVYLGYMEYEQMEDYIQNALREK